jgi:hypothetical protein
MDRSVRIDVDRGYVPTTRLFAVESNLQGQGPPMVAR